MQRVTVKKIELLDTLKTNRAAHRLIFEEALEGFREEVIKQLEQSLADAKAGRKLRTYIALDEPMDQTRDYDRAIKMLEMSVDEEVDLTQQEFAQLVLDDWTWKHQFIETSTLYAKSLGA